MTPNYQNKRINYCFIAEDGEPHIVFVIKWEKGNLYFINTDWDSKISYHTPRSGKSQVHIKINKRLPVKPDYCCSIEEIKGLRRVGGSGIKLSKVINLPKTSTEKGHNIVLDTRKFYISNMSTIQWYWYLIEQDKLDLLEPIIKPKKESETSEFLGIHILDDSIPWVVTDFTRIREENPIWHQGIK